MDENFIGPIKHRRGDVRADGMLFWEYRGAKETWYTPTEFEGVWEWQRLQLVASNTKHRAKRLIRDRLRFATNRERMAKTQRAWYLHNRERLLKRQREYRRANYEAAKMAVIRWRDADPERSKEASRRCYRKHHSVNRARAKAAYLANPHKSLELSKRRKAAKKAAVPEDFNAKRTSMIYAWAKRVQKCLGIEMHVDHIVPLAKGGKHNYDNLQVLPAQLNMRKQDNEKYELPGDWRRPPQSA